MTTTELPTSDQSAAHYAAYLAERVAEVQAATSDEQRENLLEEMNYLAAGVDVITTVVVHCFGGGPAGGVEFDCTIHPEGDVTMHRARAWFQNWWQPKGTVTLDESIAESLWEMWGIESNLTA